MANPPTLELIELSGFCRDYSIKAELAAEALEWLASVAADVDSLPGGSRFTALMDIIRDHQRRVDLRHWLSPEAIITAEVALQQIFERDWNSRFGRAA